MIPVIKFLVDQSLPCYEHVLYNDLGIASLQVLYGLESPSFLAARQEVIFDFFPDDFMNLCLRFHLDRHWICNEVLIHNLEAFRHSGMIPTGIPDIIWFSSIGELAIEFLFSSKGVLAVEFLIAY